MPPLLTLDHLSLAYGHVPLLEDVSLRIDPGERVALIGRNGSGKSSLLKVVAGEVVPDGGTIWRSPGVNAARLAQDVPESSTRTVRQRSSCGRPRSKAAVRTTSRLP